MSTHQDMTNEDAIEHLTIQQNLTANQIDVDTLNVNALSVTGAFTCNSIIANSASISNLTSNNATIGSLTSQTGTIDSFNSSNGNIQVLKNNLFYGNGINTDVISLNTIFSGTPSTKFYFDPSLID